MKQDIYNRIAIAFLKSTATYRKNSQDEVELVFTSEATAAKAVIKLLSFCIDMARTKSVLFKSKAPNRKNTQIFNNKLGDTLLTFLLDLDFDELRAYFLKHVFNPMLDRMILMLKERELVEKARSPNWRINPIAEQDFVDSLNEFVDAYREEINGKDFKVVLKNYQRRSRKNEKQLRGLIDNVFAAYPKVMVIRVDVAYKENHSSMHGYEKELTLAQVRDHRKKLLKQINKKFSDSLITYAWKLEYGLKKGYHHHFLIFLDGAKLRQDVVIGKIIGDTWANVATEGLGMYYNCNGKKENYKELCVGVFGRGDIEMIRTLKDGVATYMSKVDFFMKFDWNTRFRSFGKGATPKQK